MAATQFTLEIRNRSFVVLGLADKAIGGPIAPAESRAFQWNSQPIFLLLLRLI